MDYAGLPQVGIWKPRPTFPDLQVEISLGKTKLVGNWGLIEGREKEINEGEGGAEERREKKWREEEKRERETGIGERINKHDSPRVKYVA